MTRAPLFLVMLALAATARPGDLPQSSPAKSPPRVEAVADARAPAGWKRYRFGSPALFTALLPQPPVSVPSQPAEGDGDLWSFVFYSANETAAYVLTYSLYTSDKAIPKTEREKRVAYSNFAAGFADGLMRGDRFGAGARAAVLGERRVRLGDAEAFERDLSLGEQHRGRLLTIFAGEHSLTACAIWRKDAPPAEHAIFFNSLTLEMVRAAAAAGAAPLTGWKRYEPGDKTFSVMLPAEPSIEVKPEAAGTPGGAYYRVSDNDDGFYVVAHVPRAVPGLGRLSRAESEIFYDQIFKAVIDKLKQDMKREGVEAELVPQPRRAATVGGLPGREQTLTVGGGVVEVRLQAALVGEGFFSVLASWPLEVPLAAREAFVKSFKINPSR